MPLRAVLRLAAALLLLAGRAGAECRADIVQVDTGAGEVGFAVALADTPGERAQGLMFVKEMPREAGMLFVYETPQRAVFWMKNTLIPLDMIFADATGRVAHVHHDAIPGDLTGIDGGSGVFAVLEVNGGIARELGIAPGARMRHPAFPQQDAAWPC